MAVPVLTPDEIRNSDLYKALGESRQGFRGGLTGYTKQVLAQPPPDTRSNLSKVVGGTINFGKSVVTGAIDDAKRYGSNIGEAVRSLRSSKRVQENTEMKLANLGLWEAYMKSLTKDDYKNPGVVKKLNTFSKTNFDIAAMQRPEDMIPPTSPKQVAWDTAMFAMDVAIGGQIVKQVMKPVVKNVVSAELKAGVEQAIKTGGTDMLETVIKQEGKVAIERAAKELAVAGSKEVAKKTMWQISRNILKDAGIGVTYGVASTGAQNPDASIAELAKGGAVMGGLGAGIGAIGPLLGKLSSALKGKTLDTTPLEKKITIAGEKGVAQKIPVRTGSLEEAMNIASDTQLAKTQAAETVAKATKAGVKKVATKTPKATMKKTSTSPTPSQTKRAPASREIHVTGGAGKRVATATIVEGPTEIRLKIVRSAVGGKGYGTKAVEEVKALADKTGKPVTLHAQSVPKRGGEMKQGYTKTGLNNEELRRWYKKQGFVEDTRPGKMPGNMIYNPKTPKTSKAVAKVAKATKPTSEPAAKSVPKSKAIPKEAVQASDQTLSEVMGTGPKRVRGLSRSMEARALEQGLEKDFGGLPTYKSINWEDQARRATELSKKDPELLEMVAKRQANVPGLLPEAAAEVVKDNAVRLGNYDLVYDVATGRLATEATTMGQRIGYMRNLNPDSPIDAIVRINKVREKAVTARVKGVMKVKADTVKDIKTVMAHTPPKMEDWVKFARSVPRDSTNKFAKLVRSGELTPKKLMNMSSAERHEYFTQIVGKDAAQKVNASFESKLILKNQQRGIITWLKHVTGMSEPAKRDMFSRVQRMTKVLQPEELDVFLDDLVAQRLGMRVSRAEAEMIVTMSRRAQTAEAAMNAGGDRVKWGRAMVDFHDFVNQLKLKSAKMSFLQKVQHPGHLASDISGTAKAMKSAFDNSAIFRQGWKALMTHPGIWLKNAGKSFVDLGRVMGGKNVIRELNADIISRPNARNGFYNWSRLDVGTVEEIFPTQWVERVPIIGRIYKASQDTFMSFVHKTRADIFDTYIEIAKKSGVDLTERVQLEQIGNMVNSLTGRGRMGKLEPVAGVINNVFFSPRLLKGNIDVLTAHQFAKGVTPFVRKRAAINLVRVIAGTAAVLTVAESVMPGSVEKDPRSSNFGKIKVGSTRFDVSGGMASILTLASRMMTMSSKSSTTGKVTPLNSGDFGSMTGTDIIYNFFENKLSPAASVVRDLAKGETYGGEKITLGGELKNLFMPLPLTNYQELSKDPNSANALLAVLADALGIGTNTYGVGSGNFDTKVLQGLGDNSAVTRALNDLTKEAGYYPGKPSTTQAGQRLTSDQYAKFMKSYTDYFVKYMRVEISRSAYSRMSPEEKKKVAEKVVERAREDARAGLGLK